MPENDGHALPTACAPSPVTPVTLAAPITPDSASEEQIFAGNRAAFNDVANKITNLSYCQLDNLIVLGMCDASLEWDKGLELEPSLDDGRAARAALRAVLPPPVPAASCGATGPRGKTRRALSQQRHPPDAELM